jgi:hypothetical protein
MALATRTMIIAQNAPSTIHQIVSGGAGGQSRRRLT